MRSPVPTTIILFGITGDLAKRKLLPALEALALAHHLPESFRLIGITRRSSVTVENALSTLSHPEALRDQFELWPMDVTQPSEYDRLASHLDQIKRDQPSSQSIFFLSVPPEASAEIVHGLGSSGISHQLQTKILFEKPFGNDLESAKELIEKMDQFFQPEQTYRIDHYLAKELAQNLLVTRQNNPFIERSWNRDAISHIDIIASEMIGVEGRAGHYEQTGALTDFAQSHLFQLAALTLMDLPSDPTKTSEERLRALQSLKLDLHRSIRAQYENYREEVQNPESMTETFISLTLESTSPRWQGVPIRLMTGKALKEKRTEIILWLRDTTGETKLVWPLHDQGHPSLCLLQKKPGYLPNPIELNTLQETSSPHRPEAYEHIFYDAIKGDHRLFVSEEEVLASWNILAPLQEQWQMNTTDLSFYPIGTDAESIQ